MNLTDILQTVPPVGVYLLVGVLVGMESFGVPVPGETALITGALLTLHPHAPVGIVGVATAAIVGAVLGDSIGFEVGRHWGMRLVGALERRFPKHFRPERVDYAVQLFRSRGMGAVFGGRFVALLRMLSGPLAGSSRMPYLKFLAANATGALTWAGGIALAVHLLGIAAERYVSGAGWVLLGLIVVLAVFGGRVITRKFDQRAKAWAAEHPRPMDRRASGAQA